RFDWRDYATSYGPFKSFEEADEHLVKYHANPGGYSVEEYRENRDPSPQISKLIAEAPDNTKRLAGGRINGSAKTARLVAGNELTPEMRQQVEDAFIYRWTYDNPRRSEVYKCDKCDINDPYVNATSAEGHQHPTIPLISDDQWIREHSFHFTNDDRLRARRHAEPVYLAQHSARRVGSIELKFAVEKAAMPKEAMIPHEFYDADQQAIRNETWADTDYVSGEADTNELKKPRIAGGTGLAKTKTAPNTVVREVCDMEGRRIGFVSGKYDGTPEDMVRVAQQITDQMFDEYGSDCSNMESLIMATDESGVPKWTISPNFTHVE